MVEVRADERVGKFEFSVDEGKPTPESEARWDGRVEALAAWLLAQWRDGMSRTQEGGGDKDEATEHCHGEATCD